MSRRTKDEIEADNLVSQLITGIMLNEQRMKLTPVQQAHVYNKLIMFLIGKFMKAVERVTKT